MSSQEQDKPVGIGTYVRLTAEERQRLSELAERGKRTLSGELRLAVENHLASADLEQAA